MHLRGIGYAFAASFMFGLGVVLAKLLGSEIDAAIAAFLSLAGGGLLLAIGLMLSGTSLHPSRAKLDAPASLGGWLSNSPFFKVLRLLKRADWIDLFLLSFPGTALPLLLIVGGFARTSALEGGFIIQFNGVAALIFAVLLLGERIRLKQSFGILLLLLGSALVVFKGTQGVDWGSGGMGDLMILAGAIGLGFSFVPAKRLSQRVDTLPLTAWRLLLGACTLLPVVIFQLLVAGHSLLWQPTLTTLWVLPLYIVTNFCLAYLSQQEGLRLLKAWEMAAIMQTVPLFSTLFALLMLHDTLTLVQAVGGLLALLGGIVVSLSGEAQTQTLTTEMAPLPKEPEGVVD